MVVTKTNVTTRLPKVYTTLFPVPMVNVPVSKGGLRNVSTLCSVIRVPPKVPITAITVSNNVGTTVLTMGVFTVSSPRLLRGLGTCSTRVGSAMRTGTSELTRINCRRCLGGGWVLQFREGKSLQ